MPFKAFISYSHSADGRLAPAVQRALHGIARPWYRLRTMRVFRDQANLSASPGLWSSIEAALRDSEFFLFLASPAAAQSMWVQKEVDWWLSNRSEQRFLLLLTEGEIEWDDARGDFDWAATTALPERLRGAFPEEPLYTDLRWARASEELSVRHSRFRAAVLEVAATLLGRPRDELDGDDVRQYRRTRRIAWSAAAVLAVLFVTATLAAYVATQERDLAVSRALGASAEAVLPADPELGLLLAREAVRTRADDQAELVLRRAFTRSPLRTMHHAAPGRAVLADAVGPGLVLAAERGGGASVWSVASGRRVAELPLVAGDALGLSASPDGSMVALPAGADSLAVLDTRRWSAIAGLPGRGARFGRDGAVLLAVAGDGLRQWSVPSLRERRPAIPLPDGYELRDATADGALALLTLPDEVSPGVLVSTGTGHVVARLPERIYRPGPSFSPDGALLVTESMEGAVELRDARTGRTARRLEAPGPEPLGWTTYVAFSPDGRRLLAGNRNGAVHEWSVDSGRFLGTRYAHRNDVQEIAFSPDGRAMLTTAADGTACLWDAESMRCLVTLGGRGDDVSDAGFAPDGVHFFTTHLDGTVRWWDRRTWYPRLALRGNRAAVSDDGRFVAAAEGPGRVRIVRAATGAAVATLEGVPGEVERIALSPSDSLVAVAPVEGAAGVWNARTGRPVARLGAESAGTTALAFGPGDGQLATAGADGRVRFWSTRDGRLLREWRASGERVTDLAFHPDGQRIVVGAWDGPVQLRSVASGAVLHEARLDEEGSVVADVTLDPGGRLLLLAGDKVPQILDLASGGRVRRLAGHSDDVYGGAFSRDGRFILTGSGYRFARGEPPEDGNEVRLWDARTGGALLEYRSAGRSLTGVAFGADGATVIASSMDGRVRVYRCEACLPLPALMRLVDGRLTRGLTAEERRRYLPYESSLGWLSGYLRLRRGQAR